MGPSQLAEVLRALPPSTDPNLLVGFDTRDDAAVYLLPVGKALVQTVDFFTPVVDDPYAYGAIAAANALSDVFAMGGHPITVLNIACFNPSAAPPEVWAAILRGAHDKTVEAGATVVGGHSVEDNEPKFGMAVTGIVDPDRVFRNDGAKPGDRIYLSKALGTGILTTAHKRDACTEEELAAAVATMSALNRAAMEVGQRHGVRCATDITGFGLAGHLFNIARASEVRIRLRAETLPLLPGADRLAAEGMAPGGARKNAAFLGEALTFGADVSEELRTLVIDPQTSGGLALFSPEEIPDFPCIGVAETGEPGIRVE